MSYVGLGQTCGSNSEIAGVRERRESRSPARHTLIVTDDENATRPQHRANRFGHGSLRRFVEVGERQVSAQHQVERARWWRCPEIVVREPYGAKGFAQT